MKLNSQLSFVRILLFIVFLMGTWTLTAQTDPEMEEEVNDEMFTRDKFGPNGKFYIQQFIHCAVPVPLSEGFDVKVQNSLDWAYGIRYKRRFSNFYANGLTLSISQESNMLKNLNSIAFNNLIPKWDKEKIVFNSLTLAWYHRINVGRRGNHLGRFLDAGIYGQFHYSIKHHFFGKDNDLDIVATRTNPAYLYRTSYGIQAGVGLNRFKIITQYHISDHLVGNPYGDLPKLRVGLEIGF